MEKNGDDSNLSSNIWDSLSDLPMEMEFMKNLTDIGMKDENSSQNLYNDKLVSLSTDPPSNLVPAVDMGSDLLASNDQVQGHNDHLDAFEAQLVMPMVDMESTFPATVLGGNHEQYGSVPSPSNIITVLDRVDPSTVVMVPSGDSLDVANQEDNSPRLYFLPSELIHSLNSKNEILPPEPPVLDDSSTQANTSIMASSCIITDQLNISSLGSPTLESFKCSVCNEKFPSHRSLTGHMSKHAKDNLRKVFPERKRRINRESTSVNASS